MRLSPLQVLSSDEIAAIHAATLDILEDTGVVVHDRGLRERLRERGAATADGSPCVRFPRALVEDMIARTPPSFEVCDRDGKPAFVLGDGTPRVAAGHNAVFWLDGDTGETRPSRVADVELFARLCQQLPAIDMLGIPVMPQDVPVPTNSLVHGVAACVSRCSKPIYFSTDNPEVSRRCLEVLAAAFGGNPGPRGYAVNQISPTSPLYWEETVCTILQECVAQDVPLAILPEPIAGISAPYTLAGLLTMNNAECLSGIVMIQMLKPGARALYASSWTTADMRSGAALVGSVETSVCRIAAAQLAEFYRLPSHTTAPNSDNHAHDEQNAWEKTLSQFCALAAGHDLIVNCGMFATGMTCSHEQLIMDAEMTMLARRLADGVRVDADSIAAGLMREIGPQGLTYLTTEHTMRWLHSGEHHQPLIAVRGPFAAWKAAGMPDAVAQAREQVVRMREDRSGDLDERRAAVVREAVARADATV